jgi:internalin A
VPVIVIQSKCDTPEDCMGQPPTGSTEDFSFLDKGQVSAKQGRYLDEVMAALKKAVRQALRLRGPIAIGIGRARVRDRLREMVRENPERNRLVDRADFDRICDQGRDISDKGALLDYLHYTGAVGVVAGQIVLDQSWALHAIYSLFERKRVLPLLQALGGRFTRANLEDLAWSQYSRTEQEVFLRMMADCGICFRVRALRDQEWEYIAPELLPGWPEAERKILIPAQVSEPRAQAEARFSFLHEGILRDYLSRIGKHAGNAANYWRYGFAFREETTGSMVLMQSAWENQETQSGPGSLKFEAWGGDAAELVEILLADLQRLPIGEQPVIHWKRRTEEQLSPTSVADASRERSEDLLSLSIAPIGSEASGDPEVYISYAWGDETAAGKIRGEIADGVEECAQAEGWTVRRDMNEIAPGASISEFMSRIQHGGLIIAILSRRYLERPRCMAELYGVFVDGRSNRKEFRKRIVPVVLDDAHIGTIDGRAEVARYWEAQYKKVERNLRRLGREDLLEYLSMKEWYLKVGGLLHYISDIKCPWGNDAIRANNYATLRAMLSSRRAGSR